MIAIIPARGGSKGLPGKNIRPLCGCPLIEHSIRLALETPSISRVIVSTDSAAIAEVAKTAGAEIPFMRPAELAGDKSLAIDTYLYTVERLMREEKQKIDSFAVMLPTSPLGLVEDIEGSIALFREKKADSVLSIVENEHPIEFALTLTKDSQLNPKAGLLKLANHQELPKTYRANGVIYIFDYEFLNRNRTYFSNQTYGYLMPAERSADINSLFEFEFAEFLLQRRMNKGGLNLHGQSRA